MDRLLGPNGPRFADCVAGEVEFESTQIEGSWGGKVKLTEGGLRKGLSCGGQHLFVKG